MIEIVVRIAFAFVLLSLLMNLYSLLKGPSPLERILALDTLYINSVAIIILYGILLSTSLYFEVALLIATLGFVGTVALTKFTLRGNIVD